MQCMHLRFTMKFHLKVQTRKELAISRSVLSAVVYVRRQTPANAAWQESLIDQKTSFTREYRGLL